MTSTASGSGAGSLIDDSGPLLDSQAETADQIRTWARSLSGVTQQIAQNDPEFRAILQKGPGFAQEVSSLLDQVKPTLPILLANLTTISQILLTYNPSLEQLLVIFPGIIAAQQSFGLPKNNPTGLPSGDFALTINDPPPCTVGFLPPSQWRNPADEEIVDTPDGLYCKLPQDSPIAVRGARNYPCMGHPGKRAPTVELCNDPRGYQPTAIRQHILGAYPIDPNLVSQGVPLDDRVDFNERIYAPVEGTPLPAGATRRAQSARRGTAGGTATTDGPVAPARRRPRHRSRRRPLRATRSTGCRYLGRPLPQRLPATPRPAASGLACRCAKCVQRQRLWRSIAGGRALQPGDGRVHRAGRSDGAGAESGCRRRAEVVEGSPAVLMPTASTTVRRFAPSGRATRCRAAGSCRTRRCRSR